MAGFNDTKPTQEYIDRVKELLKDDERFKEENLPELLAFSCWRHDYPLPKSFFESEEVKFGDEDSTNLDTFIESLESFAESLEDISDEDLLEFADHPVSHQHGDKSHSHEGGENSHTHESMPGTYSKSTASKSQEEQMFKEEILEALGLPKETAETDIVKAVKAFKESNFSDEEKKTLTELKFAHRVNHFSEEVSGLDLAPGTQREKATKLATLERDVDEAAVKERLGDWKIFQEAAKTANITTAVLRAHSEGGVTETGEAEKKIQKHAEDNKIPFDRALAQIATSNQSLFSEYYKEKNPS